MIQLKDLSTSVEKWFLSNPDPPRQMPWSWLYTTGRTVYAVVRDLTHGQLSLHGMSLVYTTLLSMVPLLALSFSVLKSMDMHQRIEPFLFQFFEPMGPQGVMIAEQVLAFVDRIKVGVLGSIGLLLLIFTVISLVQKIETSFNMIWRVPNLRTPGQRFSNYLSVIMVGPLLMVSAAGISASVLSSTVVQTIMAIDPFGVVIILLSRLAPFLLIAAAFTFIYVFMPNTRVKIGSAFIGGLVAGFLWQAASMAFALFVAASTRYAAIYSSFAIGIFLLIWVYLNWMILLAGATTVFYLQYPESITRRKWVEPSPELLERVAVMIMWWVCKSFASAQSPPRREFIDYRLNVPGDITRNIREKLMRGGLLNIAGSRGDLLVPGRDLALITVGDVLAVVRKDEDKIVARLPDILPEGFKDTEKMDRDVSFAALLRPDADAGQKNAAPPS